MKEQNNTDVKQRILDAAHKLFINNGFDGTSIRDIANASDTNIAMVNYYFQSKYNLFEIIFDEAFDILMLKVFSIVESEKPFFEIVEHWIHAYYDILLEYPQIPIFIINEANKNPDRLVERIQTRKPYEIFTIISKRIESEVERGTIIETSTIDFMLNIISLCLFPFMFGKLATHVAGRHPSEYEEILKNHKTYVVDFVINALKKR